VTGAGHAATSHPTATAATTTAVTARAAAAFQASGRAFAHAGGSGTTRAFTCSFAGGRTFLSGPRLIPKRLWSTVVVASTSSSPSISRTDASKGDRDARAVSDQRAVEPIEPAADRRPPP
jgi:hypothetical protein